MQSSLGLVSFAGCVVYISVDYWQEITVSEFVPLKASSAALESEILDLSV